MKSYSDLYDLCISERNRKQAIHDAMKSKRIKKLLKQRHMSPEDALAQSYQWVLNYPEVKHKPILIYDGITHKERTIIVPTLEELVVQHTVVNVLKPIIMRGMYEHSYASIPKRGIHKGKKTIEKWIRHDPKNCRYVLKLDIHHFFDSISHDVIETLLRTYIRDDQLLALIFRILDTTSSGLPLGFYTSQWLANWLLQSLDHFIKECLHATHYIRYMDDIVIFGRNKKKLHFFKVQIESFMNNVLDLELKENWQVFKFGDGGRDLDFMGFRFFFNRTILRRSIMLRASRKARRIYKKKRLTIYDARQMLSYVGAISCTNTYHMYELRIKPFLRIKDLKRKMSLCSRASDAYVYSKLIKAYL